MSDNTWCISEFVLKKTIYPHIYRPLGFHLKIEMPSLDLAQNFFRLRSTWEIFARTYAYKTVNMLHVTCTQNH